MINNYEIASKKIEELSNLDFLSEKNGQLKNEIIKHISEGKNKENFQQKIEVQYNKLLEEIKDNSNIQLTSKDKSEIDIINLLDDLISEYKDQNNLKKIESLEKKLLDNLDENSFSELIKLKSQLNRD